MNKCSALSAAALCGLWALLVSGCVSVVVEEDWNASADQQWVEQANPASSSTAGQGAAAPGAARATVVVLGRRHAADYETEPDFVECVAARMRDTDSALTVVSEREFADLLYPWFEPRTAPLHANDMQKLMSRPLVAAQMARLQPRYMVWIDGSTTKTDSIGSMTCSIGPTGAGCLGFGAWTNDSSYEASVWDVDRASENGRVSTNAKGQSYMPAIIVPIPLIAPVQSSACSALAQRLRDFLEVE